MEPKIINVMSSMINVLSEYNLYTNAIHICYKYYYGHTILAAKLPSGAVRFSEGRNYLAVKRLTDSKGCDVPLTCFNEVLTVQ